MRRWRQAGRWAVAVGALGVLTRGAFAARPPEVQFTDVTRAVGDRLQARELRDLEQVPDRDHGGRRGPPRLRQRRPPGRLLHQRRAARRIPWPPGQRPDKSDPRFWNRLYHQNADGTFTDVTEKAGLTGMPQDRYGMGAAVGDYDNDGFPDLYVTNYGGNTLYHNNGDGTFTDVTARAGVAAAGWSASAGFFDCDNDGRLDLFVTRYVDWTFENNRYCGEKKPGYRAYCHPDNFDGDDQRPLPQQRRRHVHRRLREGRRRRSPGQGARRRVRRLRRRRLHRRLRGQRLGAVLPLPQQRRRHVHRAWACCSGVGFNEDGKTFAGMGVDFADYDNDGRPDVVVTDLSNERYRLFRQAGDGSFQDVTHTSGRGRRDAPLLGLEHALLRLRQRRLEGPLRRPGTRDGHDREDLAQPEVPAAAAAAAERVRALREGRGAARRSRGTGPAAAPPSATSTTTATSTWWSATSVSEPSCSATTAGTAGTGWGSARWAGPRTATASAAG